MNRRWMLALLSGTLLGTSLPREARAQLVVVVNPHNPVRNLSIEELRGPTISAGTFTEVAAPIAVGF